jgi:hypothetical protein
MRREECIELFKRVPEVYHAQMNLILRNGAVLSIDMVARYEPLYLVFRGREGGTTDEGRGFFVPYEEISYVRLERVVKYSELKQMYGETGFVDAEDRLGTAATEEKAAGAPADTQTPAPVPTPAPLGPQDPAAIARNNLLERIRATRASASASLAGTTGKLPNDKK